MGRMNLCTQHHTVLSLERSLSISAVGYLHSSGSVLANSCVKGCTVCAHTFVRIMFYAQRQALNRPLFQHATHTIVVLDIAWPWASEAYGLCRLCAYFCAHKLVRARSYGLIILQIVASSMLQNQQWRWILLGLGPMILTVWALLLAQILFCAQTYTCKIIRCYSPNRDSHGASCCK